MIHSIFSTPIYEANLMLPTGIEELCLNLKNEQESVSLSNEGGYQSNNIANDKRFETIRGLSYTHTNEFYNMLGRAKGKEIHLSNMWVNINQNSHYNIPHIHPNSFLSGVIYIKVPKDSGKIIFNHPCDYLTYDWKEECFDDLNNSTTAPSWWVQSETSKILIFPSWIKHSVESNQSNEERISIAFNFRIN